MDLENLRATLTDTILRHCPGDGKHSVPLPRVNLIRRSDPMARHFCFYEPVLAVIAQGSKSLFLNEQRFDYNEANYLISSFDLPVTSKLTRASAEKPYVSFNLRIDVGKVAEVIADMADTAAAPPPCALMVGPVSAPLIAVVLRMVQLLETPDDIPVLAQLCEKEIYYRLLSGPLGGRLRAMALPGGRGQALAQVLRWLKTHYNQPMRIETLAKNAGLSVSSLHHQFKAVTGLSPLQFQKQLRLQEARRMMLDGSDVSGSARAVGYDSPSQFSREYSRFFGEAPGRDRARSIDQLKWAPLQRPGVRLKKDRATARTCLEAEPPNLRTGYSDFPAVPHGCIR